MIALVAAGGLAAALSTAAGLLLVISSSVSHDLIKKTLAGQTTEKRELLYARISVATTVVVAGHFEINPPGFVAQVVAFAFGLAAASIFPALLFEIFFKAMNKEGAIAGMLAGLIFTFSYIVYFKFVVPDLNDASHWFLGISPEGIGFIGMIINMAAALGVMRFTAAPPDAVKAMVEDIRLPVTKVSGDGVRLVSRVRLLSILVAALAQLGVDGRRVGNGRTPEPASVVKA